MSDNGEEKKAKFDPVTGEPFEDKKAKFDPITGKPLAEKAEKTETGESDAKEINNKKTSKKRESINIDFAKYTVLLKNFFSIRNFKSFPKRKWFKPAAVIIALVVILFAVFEVIASFPKNRVVLSALKTVWAVSSDESLDNKILGIGDFAEAVNIKCTEQSLKLGDDEGQVIVNVRNEGKNNKLEIKGSIEKDDDNLLDVYMYKDDDRYIIGFPEIYDDVFTYSKSDDSSNFDDFIKSLGLFNYESSSVKNSFIDGTAGIGITSIIGKAGLQTASFAGGVASNLDLFEVYNMINVSKADSAEFERGGEKIKCDGYVITVPKELVKEFIDLSIKELDNNNVFASIASIADVNITNSEREKIKDNTEKFFEEIKDNAEDLDINVYIYKGKIISLDFKMNIDDVDMKCKYTLSGIDNPLDNMLVNISIDDDGNESEAEIKIDTSYDKSAKDYSKKISFNIDSEGDEMEISNTLEYNKKSGNLTNEFIFETPLGEFPVFKVDATVNELKKGKYADIDINKLRLGNYDADFTLEGKYEFKKGGQKIEPVKADVDIDDLSKKEIDKVTEKINEKSEKNIYKLDESVIGYYLQTYCNF